MGTAINPNQVADLIRGEPMRLVYVKELVRQLERRTKQVTFGTNLAITSNRSEEGSYNELTGNVTVQRPDSDVGSRYRVDEAWAVWFCSWPPACSSATLACRSTSPVPLVNALLILTVLWLGVSQALFVGMVTPMGAALSGILPLPLWIMIPFIALGNAVLVSFSVGCAT